MEFPAGMPPTVRSEAQGIDLACWAAQKQKWITEVLLKHGALLFRNFAVNDLDHFENFTRVVSPSLLEYQERSTPRQLVKKNIYTSTEYPPHLDIVQHNEHSYASSWPMKIFFYCHTPAGSGGETPIADSREVYNRIPSTTRQLFERKGVMYARNFGHDLDLSWQEAYQTHDPAAVEAYCTQASISWEWLNGKRRLRTRQVRPAAARHPITREWLWFNQAHLFHISALDATTQVALRSTYQEEDLPRQAFFGDGSHIAPALLDEVRGIYSEVMKVFPWKQQDVLAMDNMLMTHGRKAFTGARKILVAMGEPWDRTQ